jgi:arsenate reductase
MKSKTCGLASDAHSSNFRQSLLLNRDMIYICFGGYIRQDLTGCSNKRGRAMPNPYNVLFLCTGNSARSIMAEAILRHKGKGRLTAYSAGSHPSGEPRAEALRQIEAAGISTVGLRSKSWNEFATPEAAKLDFIFTVCDNAASEPCPYWPGHPATAHWGIPDPAAVKGTPEEIASAFRRAFLSLEQKIDSFLALPFETLDPLTLQKKLDEIGFK